MSLADRDRKRALLTANIRPDPGRLAEEIHPLKNELILSLFLETCTVTQLRIFRLVSKRWSHLSLNTWRRKSALNLWRLWNQEYGEQPSTFNTYSRGFPVNRLEQLRFLADVDTKPFQRYIMPGSVCLHTEAELISRLRYHSVTHLKLKGGQLQISDVRELVFVHMPRLRTLVMQEIHLANGGLDLEDCFQIQEILSPTTSHQSLHRFEMLHCTSEFTNVACGDFVKAMLLGAPSISKLKLECNGSFDEIDPHGSHYPKFWDDLNHLNLKSLNILNLKKGPIRRFPAKYLRNFANLSLEVLKFDVGCRTDGEMLKKIFRGHKGSLRKLHVFSDPTEYPIGLQLRASKNDTFRVTLEKLEQLYLETGISAAIVFLKILHCPKLKKLELLEPNHSRKLEDGYINLSLDKNMFRSMNLQFQNLESFSCSYQFAPEELEQVGRAMPNLSQLVLPLCKSGFLVVCKVWPGLNKLKILVGKGDPVDDEALTSGSGVVDGEKRIRSFTDLRDLTDFELEIGKEGKCLTDCAVFNALLLLPRLYYVCLDMKNISNGAQKALKEKVMILKQK